MKRSVTRAVALLLLIALASNVVFAGAVTLDTTFNGTGYRVQQVDPDGVIGESVGILSDGKIIVGGWTLGVALWDSFSAMCVNPNGTLNTGFDGDGWVITTVANFNRGDTVLIQPDNKILLSGERYFGDSNNDFTILRYNTNGSLDNSFDGNGVAAPPVSGFSDEHSYDMALQPDGKIVMVGTTAPTTQPGENIPTDIAIMRLHTNGALDTSFAGTGILTVRFNGVSESANAVAIQPDGKIVIGGFLNNFVKDEFLLMRFEANGMLDTSFGTNGLVFMSVSAGSDRIKTIALQADGKILVSGNDRIARFNSDGSLDNSFAGGVVWHGAGVEKILVLSNGKIMVGGPSGIGVGVARYNSNGTLDTTFNGNGYASATIPGNSCFGSSMAMQTDGKIVVGGDCLSNGVYRFAVFRFKESTVKTPFDFDGDGKTDLSIFRPSVGEWWYLKSGNGGNGAAQFGNSSDRIAPGDFTGDGKTDIALFRPPTGEWFVLRSEDSSYYSYPFGTNGDVPAVGDFDADGKADTGVFRPSNATWFIRRSSDGGATIQQFGQTGDVPVVSDYDGDSKTDIAIYRPSLGEWWLQRSTAGTIAFQFGNSSDKPVPGDYTGDGKADVAIWRPSGGEWFILRSENQSYYSFPFGISTDVPAPGDYDGDGKFDATVFRPSSSTWYVQRTTAGTLIQTFGQSGDVPVPGAFIP